MKVLQKYFIFLVVIISFIAISPVKASAANATLSFKHDDFADDIISMHIYLNTGGNSVTMVKADFQYPLELLEVKDVQTEDSICKESVVYDLTASGVVALSCIPLESLTGEGNIATISFQAINDGEAIVKFTQDVGVFVDSLEENILAEPEPALYTIRRELSTLPETGSFTGSELLDALIILIGVIMIAVFTIAGFSVWFGVYLSLGKWKLEGKYEFGISKERKERTKSAKKRSKK